MLHVIEHLTDLLHTKAYKSGLISRWPSPESLYPVYKLEKEQKSKCGADCKRRYCLSDICIEEHFQKTHFPVNRPLEYTRHDLDCEESEHLGYVSYYLYVD